ncbi:hypothetical protein LXJ15735_04690 [Lacrimispora xylanolytica]
MGWYSFFASETVAVEGVAELLLVDVSVLVQADKKVVAVAARKKERITRFLHIIFMFIE